MEIGIELHGKPCRVRVSPAAEQALAMRNTPLRVEMEVTLACMVKKQVHFREPQENGAVVTVTDRLQVCITSGEHCSAASADPAQAAGALPPITRWNTLVPKWLEIDYRSGQWRGEFGYVLA
jgi:hypothetical protein